MPHFEQNFVPCFSTEPHLAQFTATGSTGGARGGGRESGGGILAPESGKGGGAGLPHFAQNLAPSLRDAPHLKQEAMVLMVSVWRFLANLGLKVCKPLLNKTQKAREKWCKQDKTL
ncbi:MAG: hypothetical protein A2107_16000 [Verrucomicrobia bacterium GWF2_62_7]|nr:MAG: hypothetical protein A2107_16000 [Verrucomicrobia bacterium GWF2_62_7]